MMDQETIRKFKKNLKPILAHHCVINQAYYGIIMIRPSATERENREAHRRMELCRQQRASALDLSGLAMKQVPEELADFTWLARLI
jgi:hypothetical protein